MSIDVFRLSFFEKFKIKIWNKVTQRNKIHDNNNNADDT